MHVSRKVAVEKLAGHRNVFSVRPVFLSCREPLHDGAVQSVRIMAKGLANAGAIPHWNELPICERSCFDYGFDCGFDCASASIVPYRLRCSQSCMKQSCLSTWRGFGRQRSFGCARRHCIAERIKHLRNIAMVKLGYPSVSCELRCGCPPGRRVDRKRVHSCVRCVPDCAAIEPGTGAERIGMDLRIWARFAYDVGCLRRGRCIQSRRYSLRQRGSGRICRTVHRHSVRQMGAAREEKAAAP